MNLVLLKNVSLVGLHWGAYTQKEPARIPVVWKELLDMFAKGTAQPVTYTKTWSLEELAEGLGALERRETWGKAVIKVTEDDSARVAAKL